MSIPLSAIQSVVKVDFELNLTEKEEIRNADFLDNQFEIFLKDDFLDMYLRSDYETQMRIV
jgi:hypothetical protein